MSMYFFDYLVHQSSRDYKIKYFYGFQGENHNFLLSQNCLIVLRRVKNEFETNKNGRK